MARARASSNQIDSRASGVERNWGAARNTAKRAEFNTFASQASLLDVLPRNSFSLLPPDHAGQL
jgi:hypothetical protein